MTTSPMLDHEERARAVVLREILNRGECGECEGVGMIPTENNGIGVCPGCADVPTPGEMGNEALYLLPRLLDDLEAVERERDEAQGRWLERWGQLCGTVSQIQAERDRLREEVADLEASFCAASFRVESEQRAMLNRCIAVVQACDNSVPVFEIVERLAGLAARTPEGGADGE